MHVFLQIYSISLIDFHSTEKLWRIHQWITLRFLPQCTVLYWTLYARAINKSSTRHARTHGIRWVSQIYCRIWWPTSIHVTIPGFCDYHRSWHQIQTWISWIHAGHHSISRSTSPHLYRIISLTHHFIFASPWVMIHFVRPKKCLQDELDLRTGHGASDKSWDVSFGRDCCKFTIQKASLQWLEWRKLWFCVLRKACAWKKGL